MKRWLIIILSFLSCRKIDNKGYISYDIKQDKHRSVFRIKTTRSKKIEFSCIFDQSAVYKTKDPNNQADINKLYGLSDCGTNHMESSIRFGWRWYDDSLEIHWFKHSDNKFSFGKICNVTLGLPFKCSLKIKEDKYVMNVDGNEVEIIRAPCGLNYHRYYLYPYFGGDETAPHDIRIKIKNEKNM